jgi:hypothetical protein
LLSIGFVSGISGIVTIFGAILLRDWLRDVIDTWLRALTLKRLNYSFNAGAGLAAAQQKLL